MKDQPEKTVGSLDSWWMMEKKSTTRKAGLMGIWFKHILLVNTKRIRHGKTAT